MRLSARQEAALLALAGLSTPVSAGKLAEAMTVSGREAGTLRTARHDGDALTLKGLAVRKHGRYEITDAGLTAAVTLRGTPP